MIPSPAAPSGAKGLAQQLQSQLQLVLQPQLQLQLPLLPQLLFPQQHVQPQFPPPPQPPQSRMVRTNRIQEPPFPKQLLYIEENLLDVWYGI